jgi:dTDP-glucose pyrophosphorylase
MNIIIPIGGSGQRFVNEGYKKPKPLIRALGKPIIFWNLEHLMPGKDDVIFIIYREEFQRYDFENQIKRNFRNFTFKFIAIRNDTRGAAETVLFALNAMTESRLNQLTLIVDADNFYPDDIIGMAKDQNRSLIFYKKDFYPEPIYSYIAIEGDRVTDIREKVKISDNACVGAYCFESAAMLADTIKTVITREKKQKNEYYISALYSQLLQEGRAVYAAELSDFICLGTPQQVKSFSTHFNTSEKKYRFCFDLEMILGSGNEKCEDDISGEHNKTMINYLNYLHSLGHTIILYGSLESSFFEGMDAVPARLAELLKNRKVFYDDIHLGKPVADFYIDNQSIDPSNDLEKELGFYNAHPGTRKVNRIEIFENYIVKHSSGIEGEKYYYQNIPEKLKYLFPDLLSADDSSVRLSKVVGIPLSFLNVNKTLTPKHIIKVLDTLNILHTWPATADVNIYQNYSEKAQKRIDGFDFSNFPDFDEMSNEILSSLKKYETEKRGIGGIIHGDPVLTNILIDANNNLKMIDMRGKMGDKLTIYGDVFYDYAKVYQSLAGYDFILMGKNADKDYIAKNLQYFQDYVQLKFGEDKMDDVKLITKSLLLSLIPLHNDEKCAGYYQLISSF